ncbi:MAG: hypothetical protein ACREMC_11040 [Gemmatimonadales bacterium]
MAPGDQEPPDAWTAELEGIRRALRTLPFKTMEEANAFFAQRVAAYNAQPQTDLSGLSPIQMRELLAGDWESRGPLRLNADLAPAELDASIFLVNARRFVEALLEAGAVRLTEKGYLPHAFVAVLLDRFRWPGPYLEEVRAVCRVINEADVRPLHITRVVLEIARLVRRRSGAIRVTREGRRLVAEEHVGELFALLFRTYFRGFNLSYVDSLDDASDIQYVVPYALWVVSQLDDRWWPPDALAKRVLPPGVHRAVAQERPDWQGVPLTATYLAMRRLLDPFADFGVLEARPQAVEPPQVSAWNEFRKGSLCDRLLRFEFGADPPKARGLNLRVVR